MKDQQLRQKRSRCAGPLHRHGRLDFAGDVFGPYGALTTTELMTLDGGLAIDLTDGFTLATGDRFDILGFGGLTATSTTSRSMARPARQKSWTCGPAAEACV